MNVLFSVPWDNLGGVCNVVNAVALHLRAQGHSVHLLLPGDEDRAVEDTSRVGLPAYRLNLRPRDVPKAPLRGLAAYYVKRAAAQRELRTLVGDLGIDVVNVHFPSSASEHFVALREKGVKGLVTSIHGADLLPYTDTPSRRHKYINSALQASDSIISPSRSYAKAAAKAWPVLADREVDVIPNGVDPDELGFVPGIRTEESPPFVLSVATLVPYKGVDVLIRAFALIAADFPDVRLKLVSGGPAYADLVRLAATLGVQNRVDFEGPVDRQRVSTFLRGCTVFVLASRSNSESFGIAAAEAMALDRMVIASDVGALPEMVEHEHSGLLVAPGDAEALAGAMRKALLDRPLRDRLGIAAGNKVRRDFPWSRTGNEYEALLRRVISQHASSTT